MNLHPLPAVPIVSLVRCVHCRRRIAAHAPSCHHCGTPAAATPVTAAPKRGVRPRRSYPLTLGVRRWTIVMFTMLVGGTWVGMTAYAVTHPRMETVDEKTLECDLIEEQGEYYAGELEVCRNRLAYLRVMERR